MMMMNNSGRGAGRCGGASLSGTSGAGPARVQGHAGVRASTPLPSPTPQTLFQWPPDFSAGQATGYGLAPGLGPGDRRGRARLVRLLQKRAKRVPRRCSLTPQVVANQPAARSPGPSCLPGGGYTGGSSSDSSAAGVPPQSRVGEVRGRAVGSTTWETIWRDGPCLSFLICKWG